MPEVLCRFKPGTDPKDKPRLFFTCHPDDFDRFFVSLCGDLWRLRDCVIYYTKDMSEFFEGKDLETDLGSNNMLLVPVTKSLLSGDCRTMRQDVPYAKEHNIPILPFMMEEGLDEPYSLPENFGELQYLKPRSADPTEVGYEAKLKKYLDDVLVDNSMIKRIRESFSAYIFLSYRKKDRRYANELMKAVHSVPEFRDIAIWYDEFLTPGENFKDNISAVLKKSTVFLLAVTPNLLEMPNGEPNFVMAKEYPAAAALEQKQKLTVLPVEMEKTSKWKLKRGYKGIKKCLKADDIDGIEIAIKKALEKRGKARNPHTSEHQYLMGMAYLEGIDAEVNRPRGIKMITSAAQNGCIDAMLELFKIYSVGRGDEKNWPDAIKWLERYRDYFLKLLGEDDSLVLSITGLLGSSFSVSGNAEKALQTREYLYSKYLTLNGENDEATLAVLKEIAETHSKLKDHHKAIEIYEKLVERYSAISKTHVKIEECLKKIADERHLIGKQESEANERLYEHIHDNKGPATLSKTLLNSMILLRFVGKNDEALENAKKARALLLECEDGEAGALAFRHISSAWQCSDRGYYELAVELMEGVVEVYERIYGKNSDEAVFRIFQLGEIYAEWGKKEPAIEQLEEALRRYRLCENHNPEMVLNEQMIKDKLAEVREQ